MVRRADYGRYMEAYQPMQLRERITSVGIDERYPVMNFGQAKGRGFDRVIILPTESMLKWVRNANEKLAPQLTQRIDTRARKGPQHSTAQAWLRG